MRADAVLLNGAASRRVESGDIGGAKRSIIDANVAQPPGKHSGSGAVRTKVDSVLVVGNCEPAWKRVCGK